MNCPTTDVPQPLLQQVRRLCASLALTDALDVYGRCDPCLHEDPGQVDRGANMPLCVDTCAGPHEDSLKVSSGRPSVRGRRDEVPGSDQPLLSHVLHGTSRGVLSLWCLRETSKSTSARRWSTPVPAGEDHLEGTEVAVFPSLCAEQGRPVRQRSGLAVTEEWRPGRRRAT